MLRPISARSGNRRGGDTFLTSKIRDRSSARHIIRLFRHRCVIIREGEGEGVVMRGKREEVGKR